MLNWVGQTAVLLISLILILSACQQAPGAADSASGALPGSALEETFWTMTSMGKTEPLAGSEITAGFIDGEMSGSTGCNTYFSSYTTEGERFIVEGFAVTEMGCMEPDGVMDQEQRFLGYLNAIERFQLSEDELRLVTADGEDLIFVPRK